MIRKDKITNVTGEQVSNRIVSKVDHIAQNLMASISESIEKDLTKKGINFTVESDMQSDNKKITFESSDDLAGVMFYMAKNAILKKEES